MPQIPRAFINHSKVKHLLCEMIENFGYEERQAIYYFCFLDVSVSEISKVTELTESHIISVLSLYSERLECKINFFKKAMPCNVDDVLPVSEILLQEP